MIPNIVGHDGSEDREKKTSEKIQVVPAARARKRASSEQKGRGGKGKAGLFEKHPERENQVAVLKEELEERVHTYFVYGLTLLSTKEAGWPQ